MHPGTTIGVGIIGCGAITCGVHLPNLARLRGVKIVGLVDPDPVALARAMKLSRAAAFPSADELLGDSAVDAVIIASPTVLHAGQVRAACAAGKHVYVEKPLAHDADSLAEVRAGIENSHQVVAVGYNWRFHPACQIVRQRLATQSIGTIRAIISEFTEPAGEASPGSDGAWRRHRKLGGGVLLDLASHHVDLYRWLLQAELVGVAAELRSVCADQDTAGLRASARDGVDVLGYFSLAGSRSHTLALHGTRGVLRIDFHRGHITEDRVRRSAYGVQRRRVSGGLAQTGWRLRKLISPSTNPSHDLAVRAFIAAINHPGNWPRDLATAVDGIAAVQVVLEAEARSGMGSAPA